MAYTKVRFVFQLISAVINVNQIQKRVPDLPNIQYVTHKITRQNRQFLKHIERCATIHIQNTEYINIQNVMIKIIRGFFKAFTQAFSVSKENST